MSMVNSRWSIPALERSMQTFLVQFSITRDNCRGKLSRPRRTVFRPLSTEGWFKMDKFTIFLHVSNQIRERERERENGRVKDRPLWIKWNGSALGGGKYTCVARNVRAHAPAPCPEGNRIRKIQRGIYNWRTPFSPIVALAFGPHRCSLREEARGLRVTDSRFQSAVVCSLPTFLLLGAENSLVLWPGWKSGFFNTEIPR